MKTKYINLTILDKNFVPIETVDYYTSLVWNRKMSGDGTVEIEIPVTYDHDLNYIQRDHYIIRSDDEMVAQITYTETREEANGDILYVKAEDITRLILNKRIVWLNFSAPNVTVRYIIDKVIRDNFRLTEGHAGPNIASRKMLAFDGTPLISTSYVGDDANESVSFQSENQQCGDLIADLCAMFRYGISMILERNARGVAHLVLKVFRPSNRSSYVIFNRKFDNIVKTNFTSEYIAGSNIILVGGEKSGNNRTYQAVGVLVSGMDRNEAFLDAKDLSSSIDWKDLLTNYPPVSWPNSDFRTDSTNGGTTKKFTYIDDDGNEYERWYYRMGQFKIPVQDADQFETIRQTYGGYEWGYEITSTGIINLIIKNVDIAILDKDLINDPPTKDDEGNYSYNARCTAMSVLYSAMMIQKGYEAYQEQTLDTTFSAEIDPHATFHYKEDYILGDYVGIYNDYGIKSAVQITDITESVDPSGYHFDVTLSNAKSKEAEDVVVYCGADAVDTTYLLTDDGYYICI